MEHLNQVLLHEDVRVGADLDAWLARGGGEGLAKALREPAAVIAEIEQADLRGMGGAGFATHRKWAPVADAADGDKYIICNGNEDEPGTFKDRFLLEHTPHQVIEGALIAAAATGANHVVLYVNPHQPLSLASTRAAVQQWQAHAQFAELCRLVGGPVSLSVVPSSGLYIGGEETAVIASVEGGLPVSTPQAAFSGRARGAWRADRCEQHRDAGPCAGHLAQRCTVVSQSRHWQCGGNQVVFTLGRCLAAWPL